MSTLATLQSDVAGVLGLDFDAASPANGDGPRLLGWANDAVIDILQRTHCYIALSTMAMTPGTGDYDLDSDILAIEDMYLSSSGSNSRVRRLSTTDLLGLRVDSVNSSPAQVYAVNGANMLMVYPTPLQADTLTIYYVPRPTPLANPTDDPSVAGFGGIPPEFHYGLELYMMWKAAAMFDDESSSNGESYRREYLGDPTAPPGTEQRDGFVGTMKKNMRRKGGKHLAGILLPSKRRWGYAPNPGVDTGGLY